MLITMFSAWHTGSDHTEGNATGAPVCPNFTTDRERVMHFDEAVTIGGVPNIEGFRLLDLHFGQLRGATTASEQ